MARVKREAGETLMTFSIVARDPATGDLGVSVASKFLAVGAVVSHARANVGAVATQALANVRFGADGLALLVEGVGAQDACRRLIEGDDGRDHRQLGIVDALGGSATFTGSGCIDWAGGRTGEGVAVQGNLLAGGAVVDSAFEAYAAGGLPFPELLLRALKAGDDAGGDRRGRQSAALLVVREAGGYGGATDRWIDLRVDDHPGPIDELGRLLELNHLYLDRPDASDLIPIDEQLAGRLQTMLARVDYTPQRIQRSGGLAAVIEAMGVPRTGEPRDLPANWDSAWEAALAEWMSIENLEERSAASGWIDPRVVDFLHAKSGG
jgi:uncharacterized Ntn-hydrolase superfamily protein